MNYLALSLIVFISAVVNAQDSELGTTRSEDLQIKARMEYERRNQKQPQSHTTQSQNKAQEKVQPQPPIDVNPPNGTPATHPVVSASGLQKSLTCKNGSEIRELYIEYKGQGCELFYTKQGATKSQARQNSGKSICESVFEQIKSTVEKTGFTCEQKEN